MRRLDKCMMVRMFACTKCVAKEPGIGDTLRLLKAVEVFKLLPGTAPREICFLSKAVGLQNTEELEVLVESLSEIGIAILRQNRVDWEDFIRGVKLRWKRRICLCICACKFQSVSIIDTEDLDSWKAVSAHRLVDWSSALRKLLRG